jgi:hypothetical protein
MVLSSRKLWCSSFSNKVKTNPASFDAYIKQSFRNAFYSSEIVSIGRIKI